MPWSNASANEKRPATRGTQHGHGLGPCHPPPSACSTAAMSTRGHLATARRATWTWQATFHDDSAAHHLRLAVGFVTNCGANLGELDLSSASTSQFSPNA